MAIVRIPETHTWVSWPTRRRGTIRIRAAVPIQCDFPGPVPRGWCSPPHSLRQFQDAMNWRDRTSITPQNGFYLPLEVKFSRTEFDLRIRAATFFRQHGELSPTDRAALLEHLPGPVRWMVIGGHSAPEFIWGLALALITTLQIYPPASASAPKRLGKTASGGPSTCWPVASGRKRRVSMAASPTCHSGWWCPFTDYVSWNSTVSTQEGQRELRILLALYVLSPYLMDLALHDLPRGQHSLSIRFLRPSIAYALVMARELVIRAQNGNETLRKRLDEIRRSEDFAVAGDDSELDILLAERTLRPVWKKYNLQTPLDIGRAEVNRQFGSEFPKIHELLNGPLSKNALRCWFKRLLGPEGQTAKDFDLLSLQ